MHVNQIKRYEAGTAQPRWTPWSGLPRLCMSVWMLVLMNPGIIYRMTSFAVWGGQSYAFDEGAALSRHYSMA